MTPTPTQTPTTTTIFCGSGVTTGTYYYYNCIGNIQSGVEVGALVVLDYTKPSNGVVKLYISAPVVPETVTPTPTPTPSTTPLITQTTTPKITPTPTSTPTVTPSNTPYPQPSPVYVPKNECDVFTVFDIGLSCFTVLQPSSETSFDGVLRILVTGGTAPYVYIWEGGQKTQTLGGLNPGDYGVTVVDYYGDYTASTVCSLSAIPPTPTVTQTMTPTPSVAPICENICMTIIPQELTIGGGTYYGPWQFICNGNFNGRQTWRYNSEYNIMWNSEKFRWELVENDYITPVFFDNGSIVVSNSTSIVPLTQWVFLGNQPTTYNFNVVQGVCSSTLPFVPTVRSRNTVCSSTQNCSGSIIFTPNGGLLPYFYSINGGLTYGTGNVFNRLCAGTYNTKAKDSNGVIVSRQVTVSSNQNNVTYNLAVASSGSSLNNVSINYSTQESRFFISVSPLIPNGTVVTFVLNIGYQISNMGPWFNSSPNQTAQFNVVPSLFKNGVDISGSLTLGTVSSQITNRPGCNPSEMEISTGTYIVTLSMTSGDVVSGSTFTELRLLNPIVLNGCVSTIDSAISVFTSTPKLSGCYCCSIVNSNQPIIYTQTLTGGNFGS